MRHDYDAERQSAAEQRECRRVRALLAQRGIEPAAGKHADQRRKQSPHEVLMCSVELAPASAGLTPDRVRIRS